MKQRFIVANPGGHIPEILSLGRYDFCQQKQSLQSLINDVEEYQDTYGKSYVSPGIIDSLNQYTVKVPPRAYQTMDLVGVPVLSIDLKSKDKRQDLEKSPELILKRLEGSKVIGINGQLLKLVPCPKQTGIHFAIHHMQQLSRDQLSMIAQPKLFFLTQKPLTVVNKDNGYAVVASDLFGVAKISLRSCREQVPGGCYIVMGSVPVEAEMLPYGELKRNAPIVSLNQGQGGKKTTIEKEAV